jgi:hypothetical protein
MTRPFAVSRIVAYGVRRRAPRTLGLTTDGFTTPGTAATCS